MHTLVFLCTPIGCISKRYTDFCVLKSPAITNKSQLNNLQYQTKVKQTNKQTKKAFSLFHVNIVLVHFLLPQLQVCAQLTVSQCLPRIFYNLFDTSLGAKLFGEVCASPKTRRLYVYRVNLTLYMVRPTIVFYPLPPKTCTQSERYDLLAGVELTTLGWYCACYNPWRNSRATCTLRRTWWVDNIGVTLCVLQPLVKFKSHLYFEEDLVSW